MLGPITHVRGGAARFKHNPLPACGEGQGMEALNQAVIGCLGLLLAFCGGQKPHRDVLDATDALRIELRADSEPCKPFKVVGQPCDDKCECLGGMCLLNEYAPFRFCSKPCGDAKPGQFCSPEEEGGVYSSLCVEFPNDFLVQPSRFCAPLCNELLDCLKLGAEWEACQPPEWKGNPLYPNQPDKVCISPSAQGHEPIDPDTCEGWQVLFNQFPEERLACIGYCEYLIFCQKAPPGTIPDCCAFECASSIVKNNKVDKDAFKKIRCYYDYYQAFSGTALVCSKPEEACKDQTR